MGEARVLAQPSCFKQDGEAEDIRVSAQLQRVQAESVSS